MRLRHCVAWCVLQEWKNTYFKASTALQFRERKLEDAAQLIENNLTLLGATAIEDKLQDEVRGENTCSCCCITISEVVESFKIKTLDKALKSIVFTRL